MGENTWMHMPWAERIHPYGYIVGWRARDGEWIVKYFRQPGTFSWLSGKMDWVREVWSRKGASIAFDGLRISERPTKA